MVSFSNDADVLKYEPILFGELHPPQQVLATGTGGALSGTTFTAGGADFVSAQVAAGGVIYLRSENGVLDGAYEIVSVDSATQLSVSVIRADSQMQAIAPPAADGIFYRVSTFGPQVNEAGFHLTEYFGISPGNPASDINAEDILDADVLRRASTFAVISSAYAMIGGDSEDEHFWRKSLHYQNLFTKARERCRLSIDVGSEGVVDVTKVGASGKLVRD
jgi:hypothetical protein